MAMGRRMKASIWQKGRLRGLVRLLGCIPLYALITVFPANTAQAAVEQVSPALTQWLAHPSGGLFSTPTEACNSYITPGQLHYNQTMARVWQNTALMGFQQNSLGPNYQDCVWAYSYAGTAYNNVVAGTAILSATCPVPTVNPTVPYTYNPATGMCERTVPDVCPANSSRSVIYPFQCTCNTGYKFDPVGGICVPLRECTIPDLPPITDPDVQLFENSPNRADTTRLTSRMQTALECLKSAAAEGSPSTGSAYRPPAYNQHLIDVWEKWMYELIDNAKPACAALKTKIHGHFQRHDLLETQQPVPNSRHTRGEAVDVSIDPALPNIDTLARNCCNLRRPLPVRDPVHFQFP